MMTHCLLGAGLLLAVYAVLDLGLVLLFRWLTPPYVLPRGRVVRIRFHALLPRWFGHDATTVFGIIWVADLGAPANLIAHEYRHTMQERWLWYVGYLPMYVLRMARAGSYLGDSMEVDARLYALAHTTEFVDLEAS